MTDGRAPLPIGTRLRLENGECYEIVADAIGFGGGSIIYPAHRLILQAGELVSDGFSYVVKECYPVSEEYTYRRNADGEVVAVQQSEQAQAYLRRAKQMQFAESTVSREVYRTASRMLPIRSASDGIALQLPDRDPVTVSNMVTVMESLAEKGRSLGDWLREYRRIPPAETFRILQQLLFSLSEIHAAGYLHLDIQDGNVFLRGALSEKNELLTLIDFGSARAVIDGKTEPIRDRVIFTSYGFSAPEIRLKNDGTLRLGAEADLYSVGCLALYLLTGEKPDSRQLYANKSGIYLKPNQLRRMTGCPRHLLNRIQQVLSRALAKDPEDRYRSAAEMLTDVTDLAAALQPYRTDLSAVTYDAFICYKHGPTDSPVALALQRRLENYRAPKGVSKRRKPFQRVFVDEGELSSCADFGQQVREALKNSGYLIVVCSPDTPHSPWVRSEIETFLQYHDRSRILAVLTDGDEKISFPEALRGDADGRGEILAADARGSDLGTVLKKLKGDVLTKLVAPMLGIPYDALKQRHRIYRLQRIAAAAMGFLVLVLGFSVYALNRAHVISELSEQIQAQASDIAEQTVQIQAQAARIEEEYRAALINESRFMAEQAERRLADNDPLGAMDLALGALPSEAQDRPVVAEAEYVLGKALGVYRTPTQAENTVTAVGMVDTQKSRFFLEESGKTLFSWTNTSSSVTVIDAESLEERGFFIMDTFVAEPSDNLLLPQWGGMIVPKTDQVVWIDYNVAMPTWVYDRERWTYDVEDLLSLALTEDKMQIVLLRGYAGDAYLFDEENSDAPREMEFQVLSSWDGALQKKIPFLLDGDQYVHDMVLSPDGRWAALITEDENNVDDLFQTHSNLYLINLASGEIRCLFRSDSNVRTVEFHGDRLALIRDIGEQHNSGHGNAILEFRNPNHVWLESYDAVSGKKRYSHALVHVPIGDSIAEIRHTEYHTGDRQGSGWLYTFADRCILLDADTGECLRDYTLHADAKHIRYYNNGNAFETINADGTVTRTAFTMDTTISIQYFDDDVTAAARSGDLFYVQNTPDFSSAYTIRKYELNRSDTSFEPIASLAEWEWSVYTPDPFSVGPRVLLAKDDALCAVDLRAGQTRIYEIPAEYEFGSYAIDGLSEDGTLLHWSIYDAAGNRRYFAIHIENGTVQEKNKWESPFDSISLHINSIIFSNSGTLQLLLQRNTLDIVDNEGIPRFTVSTESDIAAAWFAPDDSRIYVFADDGMLSVFRIEDGEMEKQLDFAELLSTTFFYDAPQWAWIEEGTLMIFADGNCVLLDTAENNLAVRAVLPDCFGYDAENDRFLLRDNNTNNDTTTIGSFHRYGTEDLIGMAKEILGR